MRAEKGKRFKTENTIPAVGSMRNTKKQTQQVKTQQFVSITSMFTFQIEKGEK